MCNVMVDLDLTFDLVTLTLSFKMLYELHLRNHKGLEVDTWEGHW